MAWNRLWDSLNDVVSVTDGTAIATEFWRHGRRERMIGPDTDESDDSTPSESSGGSALAASRIEGQKNTAFRTGTMFCTPDRREGTPPRGRVRCHGLAPATKT
jgi:hypothetical protein